MGLWASHDCWSGAYSAFLRWRQELARTAGYTIKEPSAEDRAAGYHGGPYLDIDWDIFEDKNYQGEWDSPPGDDPLLFLIVHSDCDGVIHPAQGVHIARRLEQLLPLLDESAAGGHIGSMRDTTERFMKGLRAAAAAGEDVQFG
jgi:hypothetical protein